MNCPECDSECCQDSIDVEVGVIYGPWGCPNCGWNEESTYLPEEYLPEEEYTDIDFGN